MSDAEDPEIPQSPPPRDSGTEVDDQPLGVQPDRDPEEETESGSPGIEPPSSG